MVPMLIGTGVSFKGDQNWIVLVFHNYATISKLLNYIL